LIKMTNEEIKSVEGLCTALGGAYSEEKHPIFGYSIRKCKLKDNINVDIELSGVPQEPMTLFVKNNKTGADIMSVLIPLEFKKIELSKEPLYEVLVGEGIKFSKFGETLSDIHIDLFKND